MRCSAAYGERWDSELRDRGKDRHHFYFRDVRALFSILYYFRRCPSLANFSRPNTGRSPSSFSSLLPERFRVYENSFACEVRKTGNWSAGWL